MSFPLKEELIELERMMDRAKRIYPDAADHGYVFENIEERDRVREIMKEFKEFYGVKTTKYSGGCNIKTAIVTGMDGVNRYECTILDLHFCDGYGPYGGFDINEFPMILSDIELFNMYNSKVNEC